MNTNMDTLIRDTLRQWAEEAQVPPDLAERALRRRRFRRAGFIGTSLVAALALVAVAVILPSTRGGDERAGTVGARNPTPAPTDIQADPDNSPPRRFVAAGRVAISAYSTGKWEKTDGGYEVYHREWHVYSPTTGTYEEVPYAMVDVAPGLRQAAVLEWPLPAKRIGLLDLTTREVTAWIDLDRPVASVVWSPDGTKLLATAYDRDPTTTKFLDKERTSSTSPPSVRTGYYLVDADARTAAFRSSAPVPRPPDNSPFVWTSDGSRIRDGGMERKFYDLDGNPAPAPPGWDRAVDFDGAGLSPNGRLYATWGLVSPGPQTAVRDVATGEVVATQPMEQLVAWADDAHLIAVKCRGACENEFDNAYVLVSIDGAVVTQLTGYREGEGVWSPVFTLR